MAGSADLSLGMGVTVSTASRGVSAQELHQGQRVIPPPLEEPNFKVKVPCSAGHPSWPESICTKCQPSAITLQRQNFRLVDHVSFATSGMVDRYIQYWRQTGCQRFAYLYGHYEPYTEKVPLGIQAVVEAIYEPPQQDLVDGLTVDMQWAAEAEVDKLAQLCGLVKVGMIFSDLTDDGSGQGSVMCKRHIGSYFMTSLECHFAAHMQLKHRNPCKWSMSGYFGSKFVTCIVSGNGEGGIDISAYQMSTAAMAMADADIIEPTVDPSKMRVKPATRQRYVPDIMYKYINEYNVPVTQNAKPVFPVEYLLTTVTHGFPENPNPRFITKEPFPIGNRPTLSQISESFLYTHLFIDGVYPSLNHLSDFHLLCHIAQLQVLSLEELQLLAKVATTYDEAAMDLLMHTPGWATLTTLLKQTHQASKPPTTAAPSAPNASSASGTQDTPMEDALSEWSCRHCTFANPAVLSECEMCGLPRDQ
ncbi:nuclear protein localization protein 4 [Dimargaris verticillata]|uniref:Nuclear protein localization protein 4 n=1 Tax=Dimargaris verticillata TaxID=2761393 RepID=A0A9W8EAD2_9FUNG|nr:nuclear protein localization protein 4 [Dimargaris verticillata]